jgi:hypothetical protein
MKTTQFRAVMSFLLSLLFMTQVCHRASAQLAPPVDEDFLNGWQLADTNWVSIFGYSAKSFTNIVSVADTDRSVMLLDTNVPGWLQYNEIEDDGNTNISVVQGTIEFWFKPDWSSGTGPGNAGRFIDVGHSNTASGWWSLYVSANGNTINFSAQTNGLATNYLSAAVSWTSNTWHLIDLTYTQTNSALYLDGALATNGNGVVYWPNADALTNGFFVGSDNTGVLQARGRFANLDTYDYPLSAGIVSADLGNNVTNSASTNTCPCSGYPTNAVLKWWLSRDFDQNAESWQSMISLSPDGTLYAPSYSPSDVGRSHFAESKSAA